MVIVSTALVVTLFTVVGVAALAGVAILAALVGNRLGFHHRARVSRHESIRAYYGHLAHLAH